MTKTVFKTLPKENFKINGVEIPTKTIDQEKIDISIDEFKSNDIIIIRSGTATSKTKLIGKLSPQIVGSDCKLLSIVNLISLAREQINTFQEEGKMDLSNYQISTEKFNDDNGVICLNSLLKLKQNKELYDLSNKIVFIDEINDVVGSLTHNESLDPILNQTYTYLIHIIKNCKKIILSDATINQNTINLLSTRTINNKTILINNINKKFKDVPAIKYNNKLEFIEILRTHIKNKDYFLMACDIRGEISSIYSNLLVEFPEQKESFILITSETDIKIKDPNTMFENKYVFYSPSITTGVSFALRERKQTQFMYMSNKRLITPESFYQMSCRTRNMKQLVYHCEDMNDIDYEFETIKELENKYLDLIKTNEKIMSLSKSTNENDEVKIVKNTFFKMWCYNEHKINIFKTGFVKHYQNILSNAGFIHSEIGESVKLSNEEKKSMREVYDKFTDKQFDNYLEFKYIEETEKVLEKNKDSKEYKEFIERKLKIDNLDDEAYEKHIKEGNIKYSILEKRHSILGLKTRNETEDYKIFLHDEFALRNFFNVLSLFKTKEYIKTKLDSKIEDSFMIKTLDGIYNKLSLIQKFEKHYKITRFNFDFKDVDVENEFGKTKQKLYAEIFDSKKTSFKTKHDLLLIYINMIRSVAGGRSGIPIIDIKQGKDKVENVWKKTYTYKPNKEMLIHLITVAKNKNPSLKNYDLEFVKKMTDIEPSKPNDDLFQDEEKEYINYLFSRNNFKLADGPSVESLYYKKWSENYDNKK